MISKPGWAEGRLGAARDQLPGREEADFHRRMGVYFVATPRYI
jgi:hypothetical protein